MRVDALTVFGFWPKRKIAASAKDLLKRMDEVKIDRALTLSLRGMLYDFKEGNDETWQTCREHAGRLIPVATINPSTYFGVHEEVDRIVQMGFKVVRFFPVEQEWAIGQRHMLKLLRKLAQTPLILMLPSTLGITAIANATGDMPNPIILETVRAYPHIAEMIVATQENPNLYVEMHLIGGMDYVETLTREIGEERLLFGSGAPLHCISSTALPIQNAKISETARQKLFSGNILRLLGESK